MVAKGYSINFSKSGTSLKDDYYRVYLRFYRKIDNKNISNLYPTDEHLLPTEIKKLNDGSLKESASKEKLHELKKKLENIISIRLALTGKLPSHEFILSQWEKHNEFTEIFDSELFWHYFITDINATNTSKEQYTSYYSNFEKYLNKAIGQITVRGLCTNDMLANYCYAMRQEGKSDQTILNNIDLIKRFINYVGTKYGLPSVTFKGHRSKDHSQGSEETESKKLHLSDHELKAIVLYRPSDLRVDSRSNYDWVIDIVSLNQYLALRISEVLSIRKTKISKVIGNFDDNEKGYGYSIEIRERKKKYRKRKVIAADEMSISIIEKYLKSDEKLEHIFALTEKHDSALKDQFYHKRDNETIKKLTDRFNRNIKLLCAEIGGSFDEILLYEKDKPVYRHEKVSSHAIRRYSIVNKLKSGKNLKLIQFFSGHSNWNTIVQWYDRYLEEEEAISMLTNRSKNAI